MAGRIVFNIEVSKDAYGKLDQLSKLLGHETKSQTYDDALSLLKWAVKEAQKGRDIASIDLAREDLTVLDMDFITHLRGRKN